MQPILSCQGEEVLGRLGAYAREHAIYVENLTFAAMDPTPTGETLGLILTFNDGSGIGAALSPDEARRLIERLTALTSPSGPGSGPAPAKLQVAPDPSGVQ
jgi:hypothetical protein